MGTDKALELFGGRPLIVQALGLMQEAGVSAAIAGARSSLSGFAEEIPDTHSDAGPLGGIYAALSASLSSARAEWSLFLPVDMPLMSPSLLRCLLQRAKLTGAPVTACRLNGILEPFPVVLHRDTLPLIAQRLDSLDSKDQACHTAWATIPAELGSALDSPAIEHLVQCGQCSHPLSLPPVFWFRSANTPADLAALNRLAGELRSPVPAVLRAVSNRRSQAGRLR
jgi:molybdopterin-guanine dinucleotide biosynthesis protein A